MNRKESRRLFIVFSVTAAIGCFSCFGATKADAQETPPATSEEQTTTSDLDSLTKALADAVTVLETIQEQLTALKQALQAAMLQSDDTTPDSTTSTPPLFVPGTLQTSHELQASSVQMDRTRFPKPGENVGQIVRGDFDGDGDEDIFVTYFKNADISVCSAGDAYTT